MKLKWHALKIILKSINIEEVTVKANPDKGTNTVMHTHTCNLYETFKWHLYSFWRTIVPNHFPPLPDDKILDWSKLKQIADDILKCI